MKTLLLTSTLAALTLGALPAFASDLGDGARLAGASAFADGSFGDDVFDRRGRGRGRGGDDRHDDDRRGGRDDDDDDSGSGRDRPRVPGGSGCDDPHDIIEHPECRV